MHSTFTADCIPRKVSECAWGPSVTEGLMDMRASAQFLECSSWKEQLTHYVSSVIYVFLSSCFDRTKALVLELLAAVCLVRGGHEIILSAFDNFKEVGYIVSLRVHKCLTSLNRAVYLFTDSRTKGTQTADFLEVLLSLGLSVLCDWMKLSWGVSLPSHVKTAIFIFLWSIGNSHLANRLWYTHIELKFI